MAVENEHLRQELAKSQQLPPPPKCGRSPRVQKRQCTNNHHLSFRIRSALMLGTKSYYLSLWIWSALRARHGKPVVKPSNSEHTSCLARRVINKASEFGLFFVLGTNLSLRIWSTLYTRLEGSLSLWIRSIMSCKALFSSKIWRHN